MLRFNCLWLLHIHMAADSHVIQLGTFELHASSDGDVPLAVMTLDDRYTIDFSHIVLESMHNVPTYREFSHHKSRKTKILQFDCEAGMWMGTSMRLSRILSLLKANGDAWRQGVCHLDHIPHQIVTLFVRSRVPLQSCFPQLTHVLDTALWPLKYFDYRFVERYQSSDVLPRASVDSLSVDFDKSSDIYAFSTTTSNSSRMSTRSTLSIGSNRVRHALDRLLKDFSEINLQPTIARTAPPAASEQSETNFFSSTMGNTTQSKIDPAHRDFVSSTISPDRSASRLVYSASAVIYAMVAEFREFIIRIRNECNTQYPTCAACKIVRRNVNKNGGTEQQVPPSILEMYQRVKNICTIDSYRRQCVKTTVCVICKSLRLIAHCVLLCIAGSSNLIRETMIEHPPAQPRPFASLRNPLVDSQCKQQTYKILKRKSVDGTASDDTQTCNVRFMSPSFGVDTNLLKETSRTLNYTLNVGAKCIELFEIFSSLDDSINDVTARIIDFSHPTMIHPIHRSLMTQNTLSMPWLKDRASNSDTLYYFDMEAALSARLYVDFFNFIEHKKENSPPAAYDIHYDPAKAQICIQTNAAHHARVSEKHILTAPLMMPEKDVFHRCPQYVHFLRLFYRGDNDELFQAMNWLRLITFGPRSNITHLVSPNNVAINYYRTLPVLLSNASPSMLWQSLVSVFRPRKGLLTSRNLSRVNQPDTVFRSKLKSLERSFRNDAALDPATETFINTIATRISKAEIHPKTLQLLGTESYAWSFANEAPYIRCVVPTFYGSLYAFMFPFHSTAYISMRSLKETYAILADSEYLWIHYNRLVVILFEVRMNISNRRHVRPTAEGLPAWMEWYNMRLSIVDHSMRHTDRKRQKRHDSRHCYACSTPPEEFDISKFTCAPFTLSDATSNIFSDVEIDDSEVADDAASIDPFADDVSHTTRRRGEEQASTGPKRKMDRVRSMMHMKGTDRLADELFVKLSSKLRASSTASKYPTHYLFYDLALDPLVTAEYRSSVFFNIVGVNAGTQHTDSTSTTSENLIPIADYSSIRRASTLATANCVVKSAIETRFLSNTHLTRCDESQIEYSQNEDDLCRNGFIHVRCATDLPELPDELAQEDAIRCANEYVDWCNSGYGPVPTSAIMNHRSFANFWGFTFVPMLLEGLAQLPIEAWGQYHEPTAVDYNSDFWDALVDVKLCDALLYDGRHESSAAPFNPIMKRNHDLQGINGRLRITPYPGDNIPLSDGYYDWSGEITETELFYGDGRRRHQLHSGAILKNLDMPFIREAVVADPCDHPMVCGFIDTPNPMQPDTYHQQILSTIDVFPSWKCHFNKIHTASAYVKSNLKQFYTPTLTSMDRSMLQTIFALPMRDPIDLTNTPESTRKTMCTTISICTSKH